MSNAPLSSIIQMGMPLWNPYHTPSNHESLRLKSKCRLCDYRFFFRFGVMFCVERTPENKRVSKETCLPVSSVVWNRCFSFVWTTCWTSSTLARSCVISLQANTFRMHAHNHQNYGNYQVECQRCSEHVSGTPRRLDSNYCVINQA